MPNYNFVLRNPYKPGNEEKVREVKKMVDAKVRNKRLTALFKPDKVPVKLVVSFDRKNRFHCKTDLQVYPKHWDFSQQRLKQQAAGAQDVNRDIEKLKDEVQDYYLELKRLNEAPTYEQMKKLIQEFVSTKVKPKFQNEEQSFFDVYDEFIERKEKELHKRTIQKFKSSRKMLQAFTDKYYSTYFDFDSIDVNFIDKYKSYLCYEAYNQKSKEKDKAKRKGFRDDTTAKYIENLKNFLRWSYERNMHQNTIFQHSEFKAKRDNNLDIVTMTIHELKRFYEIDLSKKPSLERVRDVYCFQAFTGQRWSDATAFKKEDLHGDTWIFEAYKTKKTTVIPLVGYAAPALDILKKYNYKLPVISNQKFNDFLKLAAKEEKAELTRLVEINRFQGNKKLSYTEPLHEVISSHMARRTAVSILLNIYNVPVNQVMEITGHTDYKTLKRYIDKDKQALRENMEKTRSVDEIMKVSKTA